MVWKPNVTVAAVVEEDDRFLLVEENAADRLVLNQPAGHLEPGESLMQAVIREVREETAYEFLPEAISGIYRWHHRQHDTTYLRFCFAGRLTSHDAQRRLDPDIERVVWLSAVQLAEQAERLRSPMVLRCVEDYLHGRRYPLSLLVDLP